MRGICRALPRKQPRINCSVLLPARRLASYKSLLPVDFDAWQVRLLQTWNELDMQCSVFLPPPLPRARKLNGSSSFTASQDTLHGICSRHGRRSTARSRKYLSYWTQPVFGVFRIRWRRMAEDYGIAKCQHKHDRKFTIQSKAIHKYKIDGERGNIPYSRVILIFHLHPNII